MPRPVVSCKHCGLDVRQRGAGTWETAPEAGLPSTKCTGSPYGHRPPNAVPKSLKKKIGAKPNDSTAG